MKTPALTKLIVDALENLKGQDIRVMDVKALTPMTDVMILCTGTSTRHCAALASNVLDEAKSKGVRPLGVEGLDQGEWALVDLNGVLVHVMQAQTRAFYQLEKLWGLEGGERADLADAPEGPDTLRRASTRRPPKPD
jgi:ribosome-associated protein